MIVTCENAFVFVEGLKTCEVLEDSGDYAVTHQVVKKGLSTRATEALVRKLLSAKKDKTREEIDPNIRKLQDELSERLGAEVTIKHDSRGHGELKIRYSSLDELDGILENFK